MQKKKERCSQYFDIANK